MKYFIAPNGKLYKEKKYFLMFPCCIQVDSVRITELWGDSYQLNMKKGDELLFPADMCPFFVPDNMERKRQFVDQGGGFRLDM